MGMQAHGLVHLPAHLHHGIQAGHGFLKDHGDFRAPQGPALLFRQDGNIPPVQQDFSPGHLAGKLDKAHNGPGGHAFSAARFPHHAHDLPRGYPQPYAVHRRDHTLFRVKADGEVFDLQHSLFHRRVPLLFFLPGIQHVQQAVAKEIKGQHDQHDRRAGHKAQPGRVVQVLPPRVDHQPPGGVGRLNAKA